MLALATLAYADDYEKWCAPIIEIYGVCSPELVANWMAHQNDTYIKPGMPQSPQPDAKPEPIATSTLPRNESLMEPPAQSGTSSTAGTSDGPNIPSSPSGAPTINYTMFYVPVKENKTQENRTGGFIKVEMNKDYVEPEAAGNGEGTDGGIPLWLFSTLVVPAGIIVVNLRKG
jgi:hypothetical protein